ncbi:hypothetical protein B0F90DRAFT_836892 [Multifurca ochricompacta]|uniref:Uncharacterized protein n=1 Tax=Multifurca ochricompacta TaxID=376703 RepID=A0AAD4QKV8_9AGAM|nr:hypothetical protein B0F90DRAFT_836892 [Multifurca ochricompacta]
MIPIDNIIVICVDVFSDLNLRLTCQMLTVIHTYHFDSVHPNAITGRGGGGDASLQCPFPDASLGQGNDEQFIIRRHLCPVPVRTSLFLSSPSFFFPLPLTRSTVDYNYCGLDKPGGGSQIRLNVRRHSRVAYHDASFFLKNVLQLYYVVGA